MNFIRRRLPKQRSLYGATRIRAEGMSFASKLEYALYSQLKLLEKAGEITELQCQDHVYLTGAEILYIPDFKFFDLKKDCHVWAEAKGIETDVWRIKRRLWIHYGPGELQVWKANRIGLFLSETLFSKAL